LRAIACGLEFDELPYTEDLYQVTYEPLFPHLKRVICCGLAAKKWFRETAPPCARAIPLPLGFLNCKKLQGNAENNKIVLVGHFGSSLMGVNYDYQLHPPFYDYPCGLMADPCTPLHLREDPELLREFPPKLLEGLYGMCWSTPEMIFSVLQSLIHGRQLLRDRGVPEDELHQWDKTIARFA